MKHKKKLYVHIGWPKTGTSTIQKFLNQNNKLLAREYNLLYPSFEERDIDSPGHVSHWSLYLNEHNYTYHPKSISNIILAFKKCIDFCEKRKINRIIISNEDPANDFLIQTISMLKEEFNLDVYIICYLRRQDKWIESGWKHWGCKCLDSIDIYIDHLIKDPKKSLYYFDCLEKWKNIFGKSKIIARVYEKEQLPNGLLENFFDIFNIKYDNNKFVKEDNVNPGIPPVLIELTKLCRTFLSGQHDHRLYNLFQSSLNSNNYTKRAFDNYNILSYARAIEILNNFEENNKKTAKEYLGRKDGMLFLEPWPTPNASWEPYKLNFEKAVPVVMEIMLNYFDRLNHQGNRIKTLENQIGQIINELKELRLKHSDKYKKL